MDSGSGFAGASARAYEIGEAFQANQDERTAEIFWLNGSAVGHMAG